MLVIKCYLYLPFLYRAIHASASPRSAVHQHESIETFVEKFFQAIFSIMEDFALRYRHYGTWYTGRCCISVALAALAAVRSGAVRVPEDWKVRILRLIADLSWWSAESKDLGRGAQVLDSIISTFD
jgi:hypothetical protein